MPAREPITAGRRFGRLTVIREVEQYRVPKTGQTQRRFLFRCDCGTEKILIFGTVKRGVVVSCGCFMREMVDNTRLTHGHTLGRKRSRVFSIWVGMRRRCNNPNYSRYADYGGRGIRVCDRWNESFEAFLEDMGEPPTPTHSIDRYPDNDGNYEPGNCRWATSAEQHSNKKKRGRHS
jgi:hypothetical protein